MKKLTIFVVSLILVSAGFLCGCFENSGNKNDRKNNNGSQEEITLYEHYNTGGDQAIIAFGEWIFAQTFTVHTTHYVTKLKLKISIFGSIDDVGDVFISICETENGEPKNDSLATKIFSGDSILELISNYDESDYDDSDWKDIVFDHPIELTKDMQYAITLQAPNAYEGNGITWYYNESSGENGYSDGYEILSSDNGNTWNVQSTDFMFEVYGYEKSEES